MSFFGISRLRTNALVSMLVLFGGICSGSDAQSASMEELVKAAQKEGSLNYIDRSGFSALKFTKAIERGIKKKYGITLRINGTSGPSMSKMVSRLIQERRANHKPSTDLIRLSTRQRVRLLGKGVTEAVDWRAYDKSIKPEEISGDGSGLIVAARYVAIVYNSNKITKDMVPNGIEDLANPKYKGMIGTTPYGTGWAEIALLHGRDFALGLAKKVAPNIGGYTGSSAFEPVITGQLPIFAFSTNADLALEAKAKGAPLEVMVPFHAYLMGSVSMLKGSVKPNAARLFTIFLRTAEGQQILRTHRKEDSPFIKNSKAYEVIKKAKAAGQRVLLYTEKDVTKNNDIFRKMVPQINKLIKSRAR